MRMRSLTPGVLLIAAASCRGGVVSLGQGGPTPFRFGEPVVVPELATSNRRDNPTLTADLLEIYFTSNEDPQSNGDVWSAQRTSITAPFQNAAPLAGINSTDRETSSAISADGLTLWFASDRPGGTGALDIWVAQRPNRTAAAWSPPTNLAELNTSADDIPRPPGQHQLIMPLASTKRTPSNEAERVYQTYLASRASPAEPFQSPAAIPEVDQHDRSVVDGLLTDDGLALFFASPADSSSPPDAGARPDAGTADLDIFIAFRRSTEDWFRVVVAPPDLNSSGNDRDPWLSPDGSVFYFTSDRDGDMHIYRAAVLPRPP